MKKAKILLVLLLALPTLIFAQMDCSGTLKSLQVDPPFNLSSLSKSAVCVSGHTYEFVVPLSKGYQYRFIFYASSVFNNDIQFKMIDLNSNKEFLNLPGKSEMNERGTAVLAPYYDEKTYKEIHPYFDILPSSSTSMKIVIDVKETADLIKGCITVVVLDKEFEEGTF
ncbi:MAG: hypothetical protein JXL97_10855 [Bacteroidales bacterium]|nr:hypothetical protein [Bacteroidales bacterium]